MSGFDYLAADIDAAREVMGLKSANASKGQGGPPTRKRQLEVCSKPLAKQRRMIFLLCKR
eukprot:12400698-Karenia_brevis.AAC.1